MNYKKNYNQIVNRAQLEESLEGRKKKNGNYYEEHHIIPKCLDGTNDKENKVLLTAREHFICHKLLIKIYPDNSKLNYALWAMTNGLGNKVQRNYDISAHEYDRIRKIVSDQKSIDQKKKFEDPEFRERASITAFKRWKDPEVWKKRSGKNHGRWMGYIYVYNPQGKLEGKFETLGEAYKKFKVYRQLLVSDKIINQGKFKGYRFVVKED